MRSYLSLPVQLLLVLAAAVVVGPYVPATYASGLYTISFIIKELLEFSLPFVVFFFISSGVLSFKKNSLVMIVLLMGVAFCSNYLTALFAYLMGTQVVGFISGQAACTIAATQSSITPFFSSGLVPFFPSEIAMGAGILVGIGASFFSFPRVDAAIARGRSVIEWGLSRLFIPILPLYVAGFFIKMIRELPLGQLCGVYGSVFASAIALHVIYLFLAYLFASRGRVHAALGAIRIAAPSYVTALGTMSSIAALPVSVVCAEKNTSNKPLSQFAMPILANIHLMGDAISVPLFCLATMYLFTGALPALSTYLIFVAYFCATMLAVSGVPGGGIIVMLPLLKSLFGFSPEMLSVMTALYLLQDGFGTAANVMGDGALVIVLHRISRLCGFAYKEGGTE